MQLSFFLPDRVVLGFVGFSSQSVGHEMSRRVHFNDDVAMNPENPGQSRSGILFFIIAPEPIDLRTREADTVVEDVK